MIDPGAIQTPAGIVIPCGIFENAFALREDASSDHRMFQSRSFHHLLLGVADAAGADAQVDSFFDISFDVPTDADTRGGGGMAQSFFDMSYAVFERNDEPLLDVAADGHDKAGLQYRAGQGDPMLQICNRQSERIEVVFNPKEYTLGKASRWSGNEALSAGTSAMGVDSIFDVFVKVQPQPEPPRPLLGTVRKESTLQVELEFVVPPPGQVAPPRNLTVNAHEVVHIGS
jgi:hypothetical protein